jgi:ketosteroid isomerase-like protein
MAGTGSRDEIRKLLGELIQAQNAGDAPRLRTMVSGRPDAVHIGTDAGKWWTSGQLVDGVAAAGGPDDIRAVADDLDVHVQGDIAWVDGRWWFTRPDGAERPVRITAVLAREGGQWKLVTRLGTRPWDTTTGSRWPSRHAHPSRAPRMSGDTRPC